MLHNISKVKKIPAIEEIWHRNILENRIAKGKLAVWLAIEERVFSVESHS